MTSENSISSIDAMSKRFGLIGGLGPPATVHYYHALLKAFSEMNMPARLLIAHADYAHALSFVVAGDKVGLAKYFASLIDALALGGAEFVAVSAVTAHICIPELLKISSLPIIDIVDVLITELKSREISRVAILGTKFTMEQRLFGRLDEFEISPLSVNCTAEVHRIYASIVSNGCTSSEDEHYLRDLCRDLNDGGAQTIILAGTELSIILQENEESFPILDCAKAHVAAIIKAATEDDG